MDMDMRARRFSFRRWATASPGSSKVDVVGALLDRTRGLGGARLAGRDMTERRLLAAACVAEFCSVCLLGGTAIEWRTEAPRPSVLLRAVPAAVFVAGFAGAGWFRLAAAFAVPGLVLASGTLAASAESTRSTSFKASSCSSSLSRASTESSMRELGLGAGGRDMISSITSSLSSLRTSDVRRELWLRMAPS